MTVMQPNLFPDSFKDAMDIPLEQVVVNDQLRVRPREKIAVGNKAMMEDQLVNYHNYRNEIDTLREDGQTVMFVSQIQLKRQH